MKFYHYFLGCGLLMTTALSCTKMTDLHDPYLKDGEIIYTGKVDSAMVFGDELQATLRYYTSDPKAKNLMVYWNFGASSRQFAIPEKNAGDPVDVVIDNLEDGFVSFDLYTLNEKMQNKSVPYQVNGYIYRDMSKDTWRNRPLAQSSLVFEGDEVFIRIEWGQPRDTEIGVKLDYTDADGVSRSMMIDNGESITKIGITAGKPVFCSTLHKISPYAGNTYQAPTIKVPYWADVTKQKLKNTSHPFITGNSAFDRFFEAVDWSTSPNLTTLGVIDKGAEPVSFGLTFCVWAAYSPLESIENGKLYQTVELEAGSYRFDAFLNSVYGGVPNNLVYVVAALGNDLPDVQDLIGQAFDFNDIGCKQQETTPRNIPTSINFVLTEKSTVSLGFVTNLYQSTEVFISKVELWKHE